MAEKAKVEVESAELPAPAGWKKFIPRSETPKKNGVLFISPAGEEIRNRKQLVSFLRSHPGGPSPSEFDWSYGGIPRRSARLSEKMKAKESPDDTPPKKRERKSSSIKGTKQKKNDRDTEEEEKEEDKVPEIEKVHKNIEIVDEKTKAEESPDEGPPKKRERKSISIEGTKQKKNDRDAEEEEEDKVPEIETKANQKVENTVDAEMKDVEGSLPKENSESAVKTIEASKIETEVADQISAQIHAGKNKNELENLHPEESNKEKLEVEEITVLSAPDETSTVTQNQEESPVKTIEKEETKAEVADQYSAESQVGKIENEPENLHPKDLNKEKLELEEMTVSSAPVENQEEIIVEETYKYEHVLSVTEVTKENQEIMGMDEVSINKESREVNSVSENQKKCEVKGSNNDVPVLFVPEIPVDSEVSYKADLIKEDLREKEVKDRIFLNDSFKWEQKKVPSS